MKNEKLIILGKSGSGKNYLLRKIIEKELKPCLKCTTRPIRKFEKEGIDYNFLTEDQFLQLVDENKLIVYEKFTVTPEDRDPEVWYYGITYEEFELSQAFIMTVGEFSSLPEERRKECFVVYLDIDRPTREARLFHRQDKNDSIVRRLDADEIDFQNFKDYDLKVTDPDFDADDVYSLMD